MAAQAYPVQFPRIGRPALRLVVGPEKVLVNAHTRRARIRGVLALVVCVAVLCGLWVGAGALRGSHASYAALPGATSVANGYRYVVRPGDSFWSIATALDPTGDVRPLVAQLEGEVHGATLAPGTVLHLP